MPWLPAITLLALCNVILITGIALAPLVRRRGLRTSRRLHTRVAAQVRADLESGSAGTQLLTLIQGANEAVATEALRVAGRAPAQHSAALFVIAGLVTTGAPRVRVSASSACLQILRACPDAQNGLRADPSPQIRSLVVRAATLDGSRPLSPAAQQLVQAAIQDADAAVRYTAVTCLARVAHAPVVGWLIPRLSDPVFHIRLAAARVIALRSGPGDEVVLCQALFGIDQHTGRVLLASMPRRDLPAGGDLTAIAADSAARDRVPAIRLLGISCDTQSRRALTTLLADPDSSIRRESAAAAAASARIGYPQPLDPGLVDRLLHLLAEETERPTVADVTDALAYSLDPRVPEAFLRRIPSSHGSLRERLVESAALFAHLVHSAERRRVEEGA